MRKVKYEEWEPIYQEICEFFSFDPAEDDQAAHLLEDLITSDAYPRLSDCVKNKQVTVCGNAPGLKQELHKAEGVIIAADAAAAVLLDGGITPEIIVTDLDGIDDYAVDLNREGTILVVHAHGDNIPRITSWVPRFTGPVVGTCQGRPFGSIYNFGGFTDGDRAVFMAHYLGASSVGLIGFDCDDPDVTPMKKGKLFWTRKLLSGLGYDC